MLRLCVVITIFFILQGCSRETPRALELELQSQNFTHSLSVQGEVFSKKESSLSVPTGVGGSITSIPESGTLVKAGEVLVVIESKNSEKKLKEKQRRLEYINRKLVREKRRIAQEKLKQDLLILEKTYALNLKKLETEYQMGEKDSRVIKSLDLKIQLLEQKIQLQLDKLNSYEILSKTKSISDDQMQKLKKNLRFSEVSRDLEKLEKKSKIEGTIGLKKEKLLLEIKMLEQELAKVQREKVEAEKSYPLRIEKLELEREKRKKQIKEAIENQQKSKLVTQTDGIFTRVTRWGGSEVKKGDSVWRGSTVGKVLDNTQLEIRLRLPETYINDIQIGQLVNVHSIQNKNKKVTGRISRIDNMASFMNPRNRQSIKYHWAVLDINNDLLKSFKPGETIMAQIQLGIYPNSWVIPREVAQVQEDGLLNIKTISGNITYQNYVSTENYFIVEATTHKDKIGAILSIIPDFQSIQ